MRAPLRQNMMVMFTTVFLLICLTSIVSSVPVKLKSRKIADVLLDAHSEQAEDETTENRHVMKRSESESESTANEREVIQLNTEVDAADGDDDDVDNDDVDIEALNDDSDNEVEDDTDDDGFEEGDVPSIYQQLFQGQICVPQVPGTRCTFDICGDPLGIIRNCCQEFCNAAFPPSSPPPF